MKAYVILCVNRGIWCGRRTFMKNDGKVVYFNTWEEAHDVVVDLYNRQGRVNNFNEYFVKEIDKED